MYELLLSLNIALMSNLSLIADMKSSLVLSLDSEQTFVEGFYEQRKQLFNDYDTEVLPSLLHESIVSQTSKSF